jgi:hypothetical protein
MTHPKRKYVRLLPSQWAELRAYWESGDHTLAELSDRYGVSPRAIQSHLSKLGSVKGAKAAEMAAVVQKEIFKDELGDRDTLVFRAREIREAAYTDTKTVRELIMAQLQMAQKDPTRAFKAATAVKTLSLAASALDRLHATQLRALGLDRENALPDELPQLILRDITSSELEELHLRNGDDEEYEIGDSIAPVVSADTVSAGTESDESEDIVVEGEKFEEQEELEKARADSLHLLGGRLVKGQKP